MQKNKLNLCICGTHLLNPYKTVKSHLKSFIAGKGNIIFMKGEGGMPQAARSG